MAVQCICEVLPVSALRKRYFTRAFFDQHFPRLQQRCELGYPDMGSGVFSSKLSEEQWVAFNNAQRVHQNYVEGLPVILVLLLCAGLDYPRVTSILGLVYILGRWVYGTGYRQGGAIGRSRGASLVYLAMAGMLPPALLSAVTLAGGMTGILHFAGSFWPVG